MEYYLAPMEGLTSYIFRRAHHRYFSGVEKYYLPFISPTQDHLFTKRELKELIPEHNEGFCAVPQLLTKRAEDFVWAASELGKMGYPEVNLNLGCPSGTVAAKGKGSGFLRDPKGLQEFFVMPTNMDSPLLLPLLLPAVGKVWSKSTKLDIMPFRIIPMSLGGNRTGARVV